MVFQIDCGGDPMDTLGLTDCIHINEAIWFGEHDGCGNTTDAAYLMEREDHSLAVRALRGLAGPERGVSETSES